MALLPDKGHFAGEHRRNKSLSYKMPRNAIGVEDERPEYPSIWTAETRCFPRVFILYICCTVRTTKQRERETSCSGWRPNLPWASGEANRRRCSPHREWLLQRPRVDLAANQ